MDNLLVFEQFKLIFISHFSPSEDIAAPIALWHSTYARRVCDPQRLENLQFASFAPGNFKGLFFDDFAFYQFKLFRSAILAWHVSLANQSSLTLRWWSPSGTDLPNCCLAQRFIQHPSICGPLVAFLANFSRWSQSSLGEQRLIRCRRFSRLIV